jgi:hypothetical protein
MTNVSDTPESGLRLNAKVAPIVLKKSSSIRSDEEARSVSEGLEGSADA